MPPSSKLHFSNTQYTHSFDVAQLRTLAKLTHININLQWLMSALSHRGGKWHGAKVLLKWAATMESVICQLKTHQQSGCSNRSSSWAYGGSVWSEKLLSVESNRILFASMVRSVSVLWFFPVFHLCYSSSALFFLTKLQLIKALIVNFPMVYSIC